MTSIQMENSTNSIPDLGNIDSANIPFDQVKDILAAMPNYPLRTSIYKYQKQLIETRKILYHQETLRLFSEDGREDPNVRRDIIIKRVARELWTNLCVRGEETYMLQYMHDALRKEFGEDLEFEYKPGSFDLVILCKIEDNLHPVSSLEQIEMLNYAWKIALNLVETHTLKI